jgi:hypothetical protein
MKAYVHYDSSGAIHDLIVVDAPADRIAMLAPQPGLFVAEVEGKVPGLKPEPDKTDPEELRKSLQTLRVAIPIPCCKLVSKP